MEVQQRLLDGGMALIPAMGLDGDWGTAQGFALQESLCRGSLDGVMDVLDGLDSGAMAAALREVGFEVAEAVVEQGRDAVLAAVQGDLIEAVQRRVDGFEVRAGRPKAKAEDTFAAKGFRGNLEAVRAIQRVLAAPAVEVDLLGDLVPAERGAMLWTAGQALEAGVLGFGFDGLPGKYRVHAGLHAMMDLHRAAAAGVAVESVREATDLWRRGEKVEGLSAWVPDTVQRVLQGALSEDGAKSLVHAVDEGAVAQFAGDHGAHEFARILAEQGVDVAAPTLKEQADALGVVVAEPDRRRGKYFGPVVGVDHRAALVRFARGAAIEVSFAALAPEQRRPALGESVRVEFHHHQMTVIAPHAADRAVDR